MKIGETRSPASTPLRPATGPRPRSGFRQADQHGAAGRGLSAGARVAKVPESKLDAFVAANPELALTPRRAAPGKRPWCRPTSSVADKLLTQEEVRQRHRNGGLQHRQGRRLHDGGRRGPRQLDGDHCRTDRARHLCDDGLRPRLRRCSVELFPTRIRYTGMSLPYHIGNGWFGGLLPATAFAMSAAKGDIYYASGTRSFRGASRW